MKNLFNKKINRGYTLLFAVLITSVVLSISVSILNISRKEVILSGAARESFVSVFMADGAIECAIAYDKIGKLRDNSNVDCGYGPVNVVVTGADASVVQTFTFHLSPVLGIDIDDSDYSYPCASVTVIRYPSTHLKYGSELEARGYNAGWVEGPRTCTGAHPKRVERAFRYYYRNS